MPSIAPRPSAKASQALKMRLSELYIGWLTSAEAQDSVQTLVGEMLAAAEGYQYQRKTTGSSSSGGGGAAATAQFVDPYTGMATDGPSSAGSPSPPPSPPPHRSHKPKAKDERAGSPVQVHLSTRLLGVDEVDMSHRSSSPGGASPVSPNTALHHKAVVDPSIPLAAPAQQLRFAEWPDERERERDRDRLSPVQASSGGGGGGGSVSSSGMGLAYTSQLASSVASSASFGGTPLQHPLASTAEIPLVYSSGGACDAPDREADELAALEGLFSTGPARKVDVRKTLKRQHFGEVASEVFKIPEWLRDTLFRRVAASCGQGESAALTFEQIRSFYMGNAARLTPNRRLFDVLRGDARRPHLVLDDLKAATKQLVQHHPGLSFLTQPEFQDFYCRTVAIRIMYTLERQQSRRIAWTDFDRSDLPDTMRLLDRTGDINHVLRYFSYEHFYVLYCRFWEIDTDKDQHVGLADLQNYGQGALTTAVLERVVGGAGRRLSSHIKGKLDFEDFIYFCLSEEDKNTAPAIRYWFQVLDLDQDGVLSGYELHQLWPEQEARLREYSAEELKLDDMLCQMLDMVGANKIREHPQGLTLGDLLSCATPANFFNMIFNAAKFLAFEHRDPFGEHQMKQLPEKSDWDRFARMEYDRMASEAGGA